MVRVSLGDLGDLFHQKGQEEKFLGFQGLLSPLLAQGVPLDRVGPFHVNLRHLCFLSDPSNHASRPGQETPKDLLFLEVLVALDPPGDLWTQALPFLLDGPSAQASPDHLDTLVVPTSQAGLAFLMVLSVLELQAGLDLQGLQHVLDIQGCLGHP